MTVFKSADILLPKQTAPEKWSVIACDQFTSNPEYWEKVNEAVGDSPSTLHLILPECNLTADNSAQAAEINRTMRRYLDEGLFEEYPGSYVYVERTLLDGSIRTGVVGALDLDAYDYSPDAQSAVRATERTVVSRIPPRKQVRSGAPLELPHILLLCDDAQHMLVESLTAVKDSLPVLYECDLMLDGGHIIGRLVSGEAARAFDARLDEYAAAMAPRGSLLFAVGDGNHSLATAKSCWEDIKAAGADPETHPARYALCELGNIHEESLHFEAIHRVVAGTDPDRLLASMKQEICAEDGIAVRWAAGEQTGTLYLDRSKGAMAIGIVQTWLDRVLPEIGGSLDYIHGDEETVNLAKKPGSFAILLPAMGKSELFPGIESDGVLPRKTFSMGHAQEKRYYMEARSLEPKA